jgi:hypothetical protein
MNSGFRRVRQVAGDPSTDGAAGAADDGTVDPLAKSTDGAAPIETGDSSGGVLSGIADMPAVQQHAIDAENQDAASREKSVKEAAGNLTDSQGRLFDPALHEVNPDGTPRLTPKTGKLCKKRGHGSPRFQQSQTTGSRLGGVGGAEPAQGAAAGAPAVNAFNPFGNAEIETCAKTATQLFFMSGVFVFGDDGQPIVKPSDNLNEPEEVYGAFLSYYKIKGAREIPPSLVLIVALGGYARRRIAMPTVKTRLASFKEKFLLWLVKLRIRRGERRKETGRDDLRDATVEKSPVDAA